MYYHDQKAMGLNPGWADLGVRSTSLQVVLELNICFYIFTHLSALYIYLQPVFEKRREVLFWGPSPYPPSPPSPPSKPTYCLISRLLLKLAF